MPFWIYNKIAFDPRCLNENLTLCISLATNDKEDLGLFQFPHHSFWLKQSFSNRNMYRSNFIIYESNFINLITARKQRYTYRDGPTWSGLRGPGTTRVARGEPPSPRYTGARVYCWYSTFEPDFVHALSMVNIYKMK